MRETTPTKFAKLKQVLQKKSLSEKDKAFIHRGTWSTEQIPAIRSEAEYKRYGEMNRKLEAELEAGLPSRDDPRWTIEMERRLLTPLGTLSTAIGARMIEWEERAPNFKVM
jgi:hypothetical protein